MGKPLEKQRDPLAGINGKVAAWKEAHVTETRAKAELEHARGEVKDALTKAGVMHVVTPTGTIAMQERSGSTKVDWEGIARKLVEPEALEAAIPAFTTVGEPSVVLAAPKEWTVEAKASA